jgi:predicted aspartyl protease
MRKRFTAMLLIGLVVALPVASARTETNEVANNTVTSECNQDQSGNEVRQGAADRTLQTSFEYSTSRNAILLHVRINDKLALLILDTGATHIVLRPEILGLNPKKLAQTKASSGGAGFMGDAVGQEVSLQVGSWKWEKRRVAVMDLSQVLSAYQEKIDGVLGLDFLTEFNQVTINVKDKTIAFTSKGRPEKLAAVTASRETSRR